MLSRMLRQNIIIGYSKSSAITSNTPSLTLSAVAFTWARSQVNKLVPNFVPTSIAFKQEICRPDHSPQEPCEFLLSTTIHSFRDPPQSHE